MATDFSQGKVWKNIIFQAIPLTLAQLVQLLYNIVDRIYIGHLPGADNMALTGVGLTFPVITLVAAFTNLFGTGGTPLFYGKCIFSAVMDFSYSFCILFLVSQTSSVFVWSQSGVLYLWR